VLTDLEGWADPVKQAELRAKLPKVKLEFLETRK
jgi:hypothetical protein